MGSYLYNGETQDRGRDVADPHTGDHGDKHVGYEDCSRPSARFAEDKGGHKFGDMVLGESCCNGEAPQEQHDNWSPHGRKEMCRRILRF